MKFPTHALLACSFLAQPSLAHQIRSANSDLQGCFEKCGKDADKIDKVESCQLDCVDSQVATGRTRSNVGPNGADSLLLCGSTCAVRANEKYESKIGNYDKPKCSCDKDNDECKKKCKDKENEKKKQNKKNAEDGAEEKYKNCNDSCFGDESAFSFNLATALKNFKPAVRSSKDSVEKCFEKCGDKDADDADKINECQAECVDDEVSNGRSRSAIGPRGADDLLLCGSGCAVESEDEYDKELKKSKKDIKEELPDKKECESMCPEDDEDCIKECEKAIKDIEKELKKKAEDMAEDEATKKYEHCNKKCFEEPDSSKFKLGYVA